jgi:hypothetical protein
VERASVETDAPLDPSRLLRDAPVTTRPSVF